MADLSIFEKYPDSWRIDHPDFGDVRKSPYAFGVISDFKVDDPTDMVGTIHSQVKVKIDGAESDWIPLFYHPKKGYWDPDSQKYNDGSGFEKAWMSFRGDDEVAVMLKEGVPVGVLGFADGCPRIGEDIVRCDYKNGRGGKHFFYFRSSTNNRFLGLTDPSSDNEYDVELNGPENKPLNLKTEVKPIVAFNQQINTTLHPTTSNQNYLPNGSLVYSQYAGSNANYFIHEFRIPVGPILYIIQVLSEFLDTKMVDNTGWSYSGGGLPPGVSFSNPTVYHNIYATQTRESHSVNTLGMYIQTALFTKERYEMPPKHIADVMGAINNTTPWWYKYKDFQDNPGLLFSLMNVLTNIGVLTDPRMVGSGTKWLTTSYYNADGSLPAMYQGPHHSTPWNTAGGYAPADEYDTYFWEQYGPDWTTAKFMVRPHTKEELQAAGMWPAGVS